MVLAKNYFLTVHSLGYQDTCQVVNVHQEAAAANAHVDHTTTEICRLERGNAIIPTRDFVSLKCKLHILTRAIYDMSSSYSILMILTINDEQNITTP